MSPYLDINLIKISLDSNTSILNPSIWIGEFEIAEPVTSSTDLLVALVSLIGFILLIRATPNQRTDLHSYFKFYFFFFFLGMLSAALFGHAFKTHINPNFKVIGWSASLLAQLFLCLGSLFSAQNLINKKWFNIIRYSLYIQCIIYLFFIITTANFTLTQIALAVMLLGFALPLNILAYRKTKSNGNLWLLLAINLAIFTAFMFNLKWSFSKWFNYHDISHTLMSIVTSFVVIGATKLSIKKER